MISKSLLAGFAGVIITAALSLPAQAREWVQLGEQTVNRHTDRDILYVGSDEGRYEALRFRALGNDVAFAEVRVIYGNGSSEVLNVKEHVHAGEATRPYDLQGRHRDHQPHRVPLPDGRSLGRQGDRAGRGPEGHRR